MWKVTGQTLTMTEEDFGLALPITINGAVFAENDELKLTIKTAMNGDVVFEKTFTNIQQNTISLEITEAESELLFVGSYVYSLDWFQDGAFLCNIIPSAQFKVVDKA